MRLQFGEYWIDLGERRLWRGVDEVLIAPKAFDVLAYLTQHPNQLIQRDQLMRELWPNTFVDDHALSFQIAEVRKALGDDPKNPSYIETRPRRGYRFVAPVGADAEGSEATVAAGEMASTAAAVAAVAAPVKVLSRLAIAESVPETHYARSGDVNIAYQVMGSGPIDLVFVMGWVSHLEYFWMEPRFAAFLRRLASFSRLILFDKRGTGLSDRVPVNQLPTLEQRMDDVRAVMEAAGSKRAAIVGVSEGGPLSVLFAATYPEKTLALVIIGGYARRLRDVDYPWGPTPEERDEYCVEIRQQWGGPVGIDERAPTLKMDPAFRDWWATYLRMGASPGAAEALTRMNAEIDVRAVLPSIRVPAIVIHRTADRCLLVEEGRYMASLIPGARFVELPGADHLPFVGESEEILDEIETFLESVTHRGEPERALATALFLDVALQSGMEQTRAAELDRYLSRLRREIEWFRGREADLAGGAPLATFDGPARAVRCAYAMVTHGTRMGLPARAAVHTGECEFLADGRPSGFTIQVTGQMLPASTPGQVVVSRVVRDLVAGSGITFAPHRKLLVPGEPEEWALFEVVGC